MLKLTPIDPDIQELDYVVYAKDQPQYIPLPVRRSSDGEVVSCWKLNWKSRLAVLFGAKLYLTLLTFNNPLQPIRVAFEKPAYPARENRFPQPTQEWPRPRFNAHRSLATFKNSFEKYFPKKEDINAI